MTHLRRRVHAPGTYFVTSNTWQRRKLFIKDRPAQIFLDCLFGYRDQGHFLLHAFVLMPDHFHLLLTPGPRTSLERALQFIKGGSSHRIRKELGYRFPVWQTGFDDHRIRSQSDYLERRNYIHANPVRAGLTDRAADYSYSSCSGQFQDFLDPWDPRLASVAEAAGVVAAYSSRAEARPREESDTRSADVNHNPVDWEAGKR